MGPTEAEGQHGGSLGGRGATGVRDDTGRERGLHGSPGRVGGAGVAEVERSAVLDEEDARQLDEDGRGVVRGGLGDGPVGHHQPPAGDPVCQAKGTALYAGYDTATDPLQQIHATYAANSFVRTCDRALRTLPLTENACRADAIEALAATLLDQWGEAAALSQARAAGLHILGTCGERSGPSGGDQEIFLPIIVR